MVDYPQKWCVTAQQDAPNAPYTGFFLVFFLMVDYPQKWC